MRVINRPLAFLLAVALLAAGVVVIVEVIGYALNGEPVLVQWTTWHRWADHTQWNRAVIKVWSIVLIAAGLLLLFIELKPRRVSRLELHSDHEATDAGLTRKGLGDALKAAARDVEGVSSASASVGARAARVTAASGAHDSAGADALTEPVAEAVRGRLEALGLKDPPRLTVHVTTRSR